MSRGRESTWWWQGRLTSEADVHIHPRDSGFLYGDGLYETVRIHRGVPLLLEPHLARMTEGLALIGIDLSAPEAFPAQSMAELARRNVGIGEGRMRLQVTRGIEEAGDSQRLGPTVIASVLALPPETPISEPQPVRLATRPTLGQRPGAWSNLKSLSYLSYGLAAREAQRRGADDALLVVDDYLLEASAANVFVVLRGRLLTPSLDDGLLAGVTRELVIALAIEQSIPVSETRIPVSALAEVSEVFLTSSVRGIRPAAAIDDRSLATPCPGPITATLRAAYSAYAAAACAQPESR